MWETLSEPARKYTSSITLCVFSVKRKLPKALASQPSLNPPACPKLENIPKELSSLAASKERSTLLLNPAEHLQDKSSMEVMTMAISVVKNRQPGAFISPKRDKFMVELTCLVISKAKRNVEEDKQLNNSCFIMSVGHKKVIKLANPLDQVVKSMDDMSVGHKMVYKLTNPTDQVVKSMAYMLVGHKMVTELTNPSDQVMKGMKEDELLDTMASSLRNKKLCTTVFNRGCKNNNIYKTASIQQCHTCIYANKQCKEVDEQVGITMTHLAYCWDRAKQMQIVFYEVRDQGVFNKAT